MSTHQENLWELEGYYLHSLGAFQTVPSKSPRTIHDLIGATCTILVPRGHRDLKKRPDVDFGCKLGWDIDF